jgi:glycosyltransferase involved in cell wall biosynthesis
MIVELVGLPGAGKTTLAKRLSAEDYFTLVTVNGKFELIALNLIFFFVHPINFFRQLQFLVRYRGNSSLWYTKFMNLFLVHNAKFIKAGQYERAVIDQGHHQNIISLFDVVLPFEIIRSYEKVLPKPDLIVFVLADTETRTKRLLERGYGVRPGQKEEDRRAWEGARETHFEYLFASRNEIACATESVSPEDEKMKIDKLNHARFWNVVMHVRMPTEKAHGLQIAKTTEALILAGEYAVLYLPKRENSLGNDIDAYYGLGIHIPVRRVASFSFMGWTKLLGPLAFRLDALSFALAMWWKRKDLGAVYFSRSPELAWVFAQKGCTTVFEAHALPRSGQTFVRRLLRRVTTVVANSEGTALAFKELLGRDVSVIRNGVDTERFLVPIEPKEARSLLGLPRQQIIIMYVGAFYGWKGVPVLIEAWRRGFATHNDYVLVLVGGGKREIAKLGIDPDTLPENIILVEHVPAEKIPAYLSVADLLVLPNAPTTEESIRYTSPIKLFEYMASGRPIIASDLPSIREVLSDETAFFATAGDPGSLSAMIDRVLRDKNDAASRADKSKSESFRYSWANRARALIETMQRSNL